MDFRSRREVTQGYTTAMEQGDFAFNLEKDNILAQGQAKGAGSGVKERGARNDD